MDDCVETHHPGEGALPHGQRHHVGHADGQSSVGPRDGTHAEGEVDPNHVGTSSAQVVRHVARPAAEVSNCSVTGERDEGVEQTAVQGFAGQLA